MGEDGADSAERSEQITDHPVRQGAILRRRHEEERTEVLLEVVTRFEDLDDGHYEYELACPTHTGYYQYRDEDLEDCFADTGLTNEEFRPVADDEIRALYQQLHDEHGEHSFTEVYDPDTHDPTAMECLHCGKRIGWPAGDCRDCDRDVGLVLDEDEQTWQHVCAYHGVLEEGSYV